MNVFLNGSKVALTDKEYIGEGGEAIVYAKSGTAFKIYHGPAKAIPVGKVGELKKLNRKNILGPQEPIFNSKNEYIGFTMPFKGGTEYLCKLLNKGFCEKEKITNVAPIVEEIIDTAKFIHSNDCLIVDANEMNFLVSKDYKIPYFLDVDSYQTKNHKATAIMDSIRDRLVKNNNFTEGSDWFSLSIILFQLYLKYHPYKSVHPDYNRNKWMDMMDANISVFSDNAKPPPSSYDFSLVPKSHLEWFKRTYLHSERSAPPKATDIVIKPSGYAGPTTVTSSNQGFQISTYLQCKSKIIDVNSFGFHNYVLTESELYLNKVLELEWSEKKARKVISCGGKIYYIETSGELNKIYDLDKTEVCSFSSIEYFIYNNSIYSLSNNKIFCYIPRIIGSKFILSGSEVSGCLSSRKMFENVIVATAISNAYVFIPGNIGLIEVNEIKGYRIIDAKFDSGFCIIIGEKKGRYRKFLFKLNGREYTSKSESCDLDQVKFTVLKKGILITIIEDDFVEGFFDFSNSKRGQSPPFDSSWDIYSLDNKWFVCNSSSLYEVNLK